MTEGRCSECNAKVPLPAELEATTMRCTYCGATSPVPDLAQRRAELERRDRARRDAEQQAEQQLEREEQRREREEQAREGRRTRRGAVLMSIFATLTAPVIISITVFDLPARLGFGASGADRLEQMKTQLAASGCTVLDPLDSEYATGNISRLLSVQPGCVRVMAAGGSGHHTLGLALLDGDGKQVAHAEDTIDPQVTYCTTTPKMMRYEVIVGVATKGRLSHMALSCPAVKK